MKLLGTNSKKLFLSLTLAVASLALLAQDAQARNFYVSKNANGPKYTGASWNSAWKRLADIDWRVIGDRDTIILDGGPNGLTYHEGLNVGGISHLSGYGITITTSSEAGRNGVVTLQGTSASSDTGINIRDKKGVDIIGRKLPVKNGEMQNSLMISGFRRYGLYADPVCFSLRMNNVSFEYNGGRSGAGIKFEGQKIEATRLSLRDSRVDIVARAYPGTAYFKHCWFHGSPFSRYQMNGMNTISTGGGSSLIQINDSIFGPYLRSSIDCSHAGQLTVNHSLFINPGVNGILRRSEATLKLHYCTMFLTPRGLRRRGHSNLFFTARSNDLIYKSTFYGGNVTVTGNAHNSIRNTQFKTSGNTLAISAMQTDPQFNSSAVQNLTYSSNWFKFKLADYSHQSTGSRITSVAQLANK